MKSKFKHLQTPTSQLTVGQSVDWIVSLTSLGSEYPYKIVSSYCGLNGINRTISVNRVWSLSERPVPSYYKTFQLPLTHLLGIFVRYSSQATADSPKDPKELLNRPNLSEKRSYVNCGFVRDFGVIIQFQVSRLSSDRLKLLRIPYKASESLSTLGVA